MSEALADLQQFSTYPPYVLDEADRERWDLCAAIAAKQVELFEDHPDPKYVWFMTRWIYSSDIPTGTQADQDAARAAAEEHRASLGRESAPVEVAEAEEAVGDPAAEMMARLEAEKPKPGASPDEWDAHMGKLADLMELMFGDPDDFDFGEYETMHPSALSGDEVVGLREAFAGAASLGKYKELLHPRDRMGKWSAKLNGLHHFVAKNRAGVRDALAAHLGAAAIRAGAIRARLPGGAFHHAGASPEEIAKAHAALARGEAGAQHFMALAAEERKRHGVSGARRQATTAKTVGLGTTLQTLAYVYSEKGEEKLGPLAEPSRDPIAAHEAWDRAETIGDANHELVKAAFEHRAMVGSALRAAGHLAHHIARAKGLTAAERSDEEWVSDNDHAVVLALAEFTAEDVLVDLGL